MFSGNWGRAGGLADALLGDDRIEAVVGTRVNGVMGLPLEFTPGDDTPAAQAIADALKQDWWDILPEDTLTELQMYGLLCGAVAAELVWKTNEHDRVVPEVRVWHPSLLSYDQEARQWILKGESDIPITPGDGKWLLYTPRGNRRPWTRALLRALTIPWLSKQYAVGDWNRYSEVLGGTIRQGNVPPGAKPEDKEQFRADLQSLGNDSVVIVPDQFSLELVEATGRSADNFEKLVNWADKALAIAVLGQNLTTDVAGGSHAAAKVHDSVRQDLIDADAEGMATLLHNQVLGWWTEFNFGDRALAPWPEWATAPAKELDGQIYQYHLMAPIVRVNELRSRLNLPLLTPKEGGDEFVTIAHQGPQATGLLQHKGSTQALLASGDDPATAPGFIDGQLYADSLAEQTAARSAETLQPYVAQVQDLIASARDYEELRAGLRELFRRSSPEELTEVTERALILAELAGRLAQHEDS